MPASMALPGNDCRSGSRYPGKIVTTSMRMRAQSSSSRPSGGSISIVPVRQRHRRDDGADERHQHFGAVAFRTHREQLAGGGVQYLGDGADLSARDRLHPQSLELMVVELVGILDGRQIGGVDDERRCPRNASAASRSATPSNRISSRPPCSRTESMT